ncbi:MAG: GNAT family N-acetyltransferase [Spirochaetaceae bacterium]|nr:GNAT family N-acetyltransferase [Spirochaetaceae bacterium]
MENKQVLYKMPMLDKNLIKKIIFSMDNQNSNGYLDLLSSGIIEVDNINEDIQVNSSENEGHFETLKIINNTNRFLAVPVWGPLEGFKMRENFVDYMKNPLYKEKLDKVLHTGRGVFRKFKEVLHTSPLIERQWYNYKKEYMQIIVIKWYEYNKGIVQLEELPLDIDELPDDLLIEDFSFDFYKGYEKKEEIDNLTNIFLKEINSIDAFLIEKNIADDKDALHLCVLTPDEKVVGFLKYKIINADLCEIIAYGITYEYRGIGLFNILLDKLIRQLNREGKKTLIMFYTSDFIKISKKVKNIEIFCNLSYFLIDMTVWIEGNISSELLEV